MFVILLRFSGEKDRAAELMGGHNAWLARGFADGVFLLAGSLQPKLGGAILAHATTLPELQARVSEDPFVAERIVEAEILSITPGNADERLAFLLGGGAAAGIANR
ncbi:YciI family protein [Bosea sp. (in: a-proteobacteria)]|uniref:YciI family protein n=1 Tax=Bosea sp. (in: a-proteobacteria) TaxID=1871050 RepID=UPI001AD268B3|nr:YciI family protein [Bosea sp. (in: a-proteobacteria)]MBN9439824.1 hypothetical protein [Bosea sp. (in: a-proteobacteria)]